MQLRPGAIHVLKDPVERSSMIELPGDEDFQVGGVLRRQVLEFLGQGPPAGFDRLPGRIFLLAEQLT